MATALTTLAIAPVTHKQLKEDAEEFTGMTLVGMLRAWSAGWRMLTPEQQVQAIRGDSAVVSPGSLCDRCGEIVLDVNALQRGALRLDDLIDRASKDGRIDGREAKRIRAELRRAAAAIEQIAADTRKAEAESAAA